MKFSFHPDAERELLESIEYYEKIENGLGFDFAIEVHSAIDRIKLYPLGWPIVKEDVRRCLINRFPFGILYSLEQKFNNCFSNNAS